MIWRIVATLLFIMLAWCDHTNELMTVFTSTPESQDVAGDPLRGEALFRAGVNDAPPCSACHLVSEGGTGFSLAPNLSRIAARAGGRIEGFTAERYIEDSILHPQNYVVPGYHVSMYTEYATHLSPQDITDLVAYLMTL